MNRSSRLFRWILIVGAAGALPAFVMRCDKAALNFQRGLFQGLGEDIGDILLAQMPINTEDTE